MLKVILARLKQGYRTVPYPKREPVLPDRFRGRPVLDAARCKDDCRACVDACPTGALRLEHVGATAVVEPACATLRSSGATPLRSTSPQAGEERQARRGDRGEGTLAPERSVTSNATLTVDMGRCLFCAECAAACPAGAIRYTAQYRLAARKREDLVVGGPEAALAAALDERMRRLFGRSLKLRQVSAGGCNACEADVNVLNTVVFDLGRFGIQFVASPRHADGLLITGPVTQNMALALKKTYDAVPAPKLVIAVGACAISGGPYIDHAEQLNGAASLLPVDLYVPGCPPHPMTILDGLLRMLGKIEHIP